MSELETREGDVRVVEIGSLLAHACMFVYVDVTCGSSGTSSLGPSRLFRHPADDSSQTPERLRSCAVVVRFPASSSNANDATVAAGVEERCSQREASSPFG